MTYASFWKVTRSLYYKGVKENQRSGADTPLIANDPVTRFPGNFFSTRRRWCGCITPIVALCQRIYNNCCIQGMACDLRLPPIPFASPTRIVFVANLPGMLLCMNRASLLLLS